MTFGNAPTTTTQPTLPSDQIPFSSVAVPGTANGDLTALEGGPISTDSNGNKTAPASIYVKDGGNVAQGTTTDAAWSGSGAATEIVLLKKIVAELAATLAVSGSVTANAGTNLNTSGLSLETGGNLAAAKADLDTIVTNTGRIPAQGQAAMSASAPVVIASNQSAVPVSGSVSVSNFPGTQPVSGTVSITANSAVNVAQVAGTTTDTNSGNKSAGTQRVVLATDQPQLTNALKVDGSAVTQPVSGTVTANAGTNMSTASLALETGGNLAAAKADLDTIVTQTATPNVSDRWARQVGQIDLARVLGATMSASNPVIDQDQIRAFIMAGQSYSATTGKQTSGGAIQTGACLLNNNTAKNIVIYSVRVGCAGSSVHALNLVTADPAISGVTIAAFNAKAGGAASLATLEAQNTAVSTAGNAFDEQYVLANTSIEFLQNGAGIYLPPSAVNGALVLPNTSSNVWFVCFKWIEY